ncbi:MAG: DMT family transporter [Holosporales bacterium]|jgi:drug/metabolite transporter (DMT)-like permease|nr:DMT family transporter [Holosporales bacterium]
MSNWFSKCGTHQGIFFAVLIYLTGTLNDVAMKLLGERLHWLEIVFFRFLFSLIVVLIPMLCHKRNLFKSSMHSQHIWRGSLGAIALGLCCISVNVMSLAENTTILFSEALFMLPLSAILLKEKIRPCSIIATVVGFVGLLLMCRPKAGNINTMALIPTFAAFLFAVMNTMIKRMVNLREHTLTMLFYFGLYTTILSGMFVPLCWVTPNMRELGLIVLLGLGANVIQLCIFLAYRATDASVLSPIRYTELPFATLFGFMFFGQVPEIVTLAGAALIIAGAVVSSRGSSA